MCVTAFIALTLFLGRREGRSSCRVPLWQSAKGFVKARGYSPARPNLWCSTVNKPDRQKHSLFAVNHFSFSPLSPILPVLATTRFSDSSYA